MHEIEKSYSTLYKNDGLTPSTTLLDSFLENPEIPRLTAEDAHICEGKFTVDECFKSLQLFENNKSPGEDGLTVEFYKTFWCYGLPVRYHIWAPYMRTHRINKNVFAVNRHFVWMVN